MPPSKTSTTKAELAPQQTGGDEQLALWAQRLAERMRCMGNVAIAFSGGVDSSVVSAAARRSCSGRVIAVTADSPSLARSQLEIAARVAKEIGIEHRIIATGEGQVPGYRQNAGQRCYFCKATLYQAIGEMIKQFPQMEIVSGTNADDLGDYRPGLTAGRQAGVHTPLADLQLAKPDVRRLAQWYGLSNQDLPAAPCLASRIAYGTEVTAPRLAAIEQAETWLRERGFRELRVRLHAGELARIEVPRPQIAELIQLDAEGSMTRAFQSFGFQFVTVDTEGFRSGNLNQLLVTIDVPDNMTQKNSTR